jgi:hypothetical protein
VERKVVTSPAALSVERKCEDTRRNIKREKGLPGRGDSGDTGESMEDAQGAGEFLNPVIKFAQPAWLRTGNT